MRKLMLALPFILAGCVRETYTTLPAVTGPVLIEQTETTQTYKLVERDRTTLRFSVYTVDDGGEIFHRKWERIEAPGGIECITEKAYYMSIDDGMEVVLTDDACNQTVDSVYLPFQGDFGRGIMSEDQRRQADGGMQEIKEDLGNNFNFSDEIDEWHRLKLENRI